MKELPLGASESSGVLPRREADDSVATRTAEPVAVWADAGFDVLALARECQLPAGAAEPLRQVLEGLKQL